MNDKCRECPRVQDKEYCCEHWKDRECPIDTLMSSEKEKKRILQFARYILKNDSLLYETLIKSVENSLRDTTIVWEEWEYNHAAQLVVDYVFGIDK